MRCLECGIEFDELNESQPVCPACGTPPGTGRDDDDISALLDEAALVAADASALYARNVLDFLKLVLTKEGGFNVPMDDDIVVACLMTQGGEVKRK